MRVMADLFRQTRRCTSAGPPGSVRPAAAAMRVRLDLSFTALVATANRRFVRPAVWTVLVRHCPYDLPEMRCGSVRLISCSLLSVTDGVALSDPPFVKCWSGGSAVRPAGQGVWVLVAVSKAVFGCYGVDYFVRPAVISVLVRVSPYDLLDLRCWSE